MNKIKIVAVNFSTDNEVSKEYQVPDRLSEKTYLTFEKREEALLDRLGIKNCEDYSLEYQYKNNVFFDFESLASYIRQERIKR